MKKYQQRSFTLIELIITIALLGILLIPLGFMAIEFTREIVYSRDLGAAEALARIEMAKINNLVYSDATLAVGYDNAIANYEGYPYDLRRTVTAGPVANLKQVQVRVYPFGNTTRHLANLVTYVANVTFGAGSEGAIVGGQADSLTVSGGVIVFKQLLGVILRNTTPASPITISQMTVNFTGGTTLKKITIGVANVFNGSATSGETINLSPTFTLNLFMPIASMNLTFQSNLTSITSLVFTMSDGSQTTSYSW